MKNVVESSLRESLIGMVVIILMEFTCKDCFRFLEQCGIDAMDPDGFGYDEYGNWDQERLGF